jgi:NAD(P)-dependent dehydrogenase (short-subunit alcohol dehydrogenase family)
MSKDDEHGTVWITGAANGMGRSFAGHLAGQGWRVGMIDIDADALRETEEEVSKHGTCLACVCDVASYEDVRASVQRFEAELGPVTALINNALEAERGSVLDLDIRDWRRAIDVCLTGYFTCAQLAAREMVKRNYGSIINMSSGSGERGMPGTAGYASSKGGINALTRVLCVDLAPYGIRANTVTVGPIPTRFFRNFLKDDDQGFKAREARIPLGRFGRPDDAHGIIDFLLSPKSEWTTGGLFHIDGGANNAALVRVVNQ